jgi:hypothetical protein
VAAANGHESIVDILAKHQEECDKIIHDLYSFRAMLYSAIRHGIKPQVIKRALPLVGPPYDTPDRHGCSLLMYAAFNGLEDTVKHLLRKGADVRRIGSFPDRSEKLSVYMVSAIDLAKAGGHTRIIRLLEKEKARTASFCEGTEDSPLFAGFGGALGAIALD